MTAFEARSPGSLRLPSKTIAYFISFLYLFTALGEFLHVKWTDGHLQSNRDASTETPQQTYPISNNMAVIAIASFNKLAGHNLHGLAGFLNGCHIFSILSASNSALYVASRTLYGLTRDLDDTTFVTRFLGKFNKVVRKTGVPAAALLASMLVLFWVPFLNIKSINTYPIETVSTAVTVSGFRLISVIAARNPANYGLRKLPDRLGVALSGFHPLPPLVSILMFCSVLGV